MMVKHEYPPLFADIARAFPNLERYQPIFAWGDTIYNPFGIALASPIHVHEAVHGARQLQLHPSIEDWWKRYIEDVDFRLQEEIPAHVAEVRDLYMETLRRRSATDRYDMGFPARAIARRLASPLYGWKPGQMPLHKAEAMMRRAVQGLRP